MKAVLGSLSTVLGNALFYVSSDISWKEQYKLILIAMKIDSKYRI